MSERARKHSTAGRMSLTRAEFGLKRDSATAADGADGDGSRINASICKIGKDML